MKNGIITRAENKLVMCCAKANHLMIQSQEQTAATINQLMSTKWGKYAVAIPAALSGMTITAFASGDATGCARSGCYCSRYTCGCCRWNSIGQGLHARGC